MHLHDASAGKMSVLNAHILSTANIFLVTLYDWLHTRPPQHSQQGARLCLSLLSVIVQFISEQIKREICGSRKSRERNVCMCLYWVVGGGNYSI